MSLPRRQIHRAAVSPTDMMHDMSRLCDWFRRSTVVYNHIIQLLCLAGGIR